MHINISQKGVPPSELLSNICGYLPLFYALYPNRVSSGYSRAKKFSEYSQGDKRKAFYPKERVLELRIFPAVTDMDDLLWRSELLRLVLKNQTPNYKEVFNLAFVEDSELSRHLESVFGKKSLLSLSKLFSKFAKEIDGLVVDQAELEKAMVKFK